MKHILNSLCIVLSTLLVSCTASKPTVKVTRPPDINFPSEIKSIAIVDRTFMKATDKKNQIRNALEGLTTGEYVGQDRMAEQEVLSGLNNILQTSPTVKAKLTGVQLPGQGRVSVFPAPLDSSEVIRLCKQFDTDAIAVLELFDSDCSGRVVVLKAGFRVYNRWNNSIADQYYFTYRTKWKRSHSLANQNGIRNRFSESNAINQAAYDAGVNYGRRITATVMEVVEK